MPACAVKNCSNTEKNGFRLFRFPSVKSQKERRDIWIHNSGFSGVTTQNHRLCECHFEDSAYENRRQDGRRLLKPNAVPTLFSWSHNIIRAVSRPETNIDINQEHNYVNAETITQGDETIAPVPCDEWCSITGFESDEEMPKLVDIECAEEFHDPLELDIDNSQNERILLHDDNLQQKIESIQPGLSTTINTVLMLVEGKQNEEQPRNDTFRHNQEIYMLKNELQKVKKLNAKLIEKNESLKEKIAHCNTVHRKLHRRQQIISAKMDQIPFLKIFLSRMGYSRIAWSPECVKLATQIRFAIGWKGYMYLKTELGLPLPGCSTLSKHINKLDSKNSHIKQIMTLEKDKKPQSGEKQKDSEIT